MKTRRMKPRKWFSLVLLAGAVLMLLLVFPPLSNLVSALNKQCSKCVTEGECPAGPKSGGGGSPEGCTYLLIGCTGSCTYCEGSGNDSYCTYTGQSADWCTYWLDQFTECGRTAHPDCYKSGSKCACYIPEEEDYTEDPCKLNTCV